MAKNHSEISMLWVCQVNSREEARSLQARSYVELCKGRFRRTLLCSIRRQEPKIDKLQEEQKRISKEITSFMALFQKGIPQLQCSECQEVVTQVTIVNHYKKHITELNGQIESLVATKEQNRKRKPDPRKEDISRKRLKEPGGGSLISKIDINPTSNFVSNRNNPKNTDDERKKMYKRVYGRKKYQYRIQNRSEDVKVTDEEIDAEIALSSPGRAERVAGAGRMGRGRPSKSVLPSSSPPSSSSARGNTSTSLRRQKGCKAGIGMGLSQFVLRPHSHGFLCQPIFEGTYLVRPLAQEYQEAECQDH